MLKIYKKENVFYKLFYIAIAIITFARLTQDSTLFNWNDTFIYILKIVGALLLSVKFIFTKYNKKELIKFILFLILMFITTILTKIEMFLLTGLILVSLKNIDIKKTIKTIFLVSISVVVIQSAVYLFNVIYFPEKIHYLLNSKFQIRHYLYFSHPNIFAGIVFGIIIEWVYLYGIKMKKYFKYIVIIIITIIIYILTLSRTSLFLFIILIIGLLFIDNLKGKNNHIFNFISKYLFIIISIFTLLFLIFYNGNLDIVNKADKLLSGRISLGLYARNKYGIPLIPQYINFDEKIVSNYVSQLFIDNFYMRYILICGFWFLLMIFLAIGKAYKKCNNLEKLFLIIFAIWGVTESVIFDISICIVLLIIADKIINSTNNEGIDSIE